MTKKFALAVMAAALLSTTALAQSNPPAGSMSAPAAKPTDAAALQSTAAGKWRASKLVGLNVYNSNNEKVGDINELITDSSGKIDTVVIGAGGFLGMGEHNVGIPFSQVKFVNEPVKTSSATTTNSGTRTVGSGAATTTTTTTTASSAARDYPDHAMVNMTKDQLKALPAFKYASDTSTTRTTTTAPAPANRAPANPPANQAPAAPPANQAPTAPPAR
jgi:sporulation protein YlmC with PRC-barrel domain